MLSRVEKITLGLAVTGAVVGVLGTVAGIIGTVLGLNRSFSAVEGNSEPSSQVRDFAEGIGSAMHWATGGLIIHIASLVLAFGFLVAFVVIRLKRWQRDRQQAGRARGIGSREPAHNNPS